MSECRLDWEAIACAGGYPVDEIPPKLVEIFEALHESIKNANSMSFGGRDEYGLRSTQVIGLVILLWNAGFWKEKE